MAQRRQKPTLEFRQPLAFLLAPTVLGHPLRPSYNQQRRQQPHAYATIGMISLSVDPFECRQLCLNSHGVLKVRTGHESINQSQPCWALPHQAKGSNTEIRSSAHEQDVSTLTRDVKRDTSQETPMKTLQLLREFLLNIRTHQICLLCTESGNVLPDSTHVSTFQSFLSSQLADFELHFLKF